MSEGLRLHNPNWNGYDEVVLCDRSVTDTSMQPHKERDCHERVTEWVRYKKDNGHTKAENLCSTHAEEFERDLERAGWQVLQCVDFDSPWRER